MSTAFKPGSPEWARLVTASKVAGILSISPWDSQYKVWCVMAGLIPPDPENEAMRRGNMLEDAVLNWWLADNPDAIELGRQVTCQIPDEPWAAATPDMIVTSGGDTEIVDAKTASDDEGWGRPGTDEAPKYYIASSMWQLAMHPEAARVRLAVLFGRPFTMREYVIERDDELCGALIDRAREFHLSLAADEPPPLSGMACEYDAIRKAHPEIDRGETATIPADLAAEYVTAYRATKALPAIQAAVLDAMGRAQYADDPDGNRIARRQPSKGDAVTLYFAARTPATEETAA